MDPGFLGGYPFEAKKGVRKTVLGVQASADSLLGSKLEGDPTRWDFWGSPIFGHPISSLDRSSVSLLHHDREYIAYNSDMGISPRRVGSRNLPLR